MNSLSKIAVISGIKTGTWLTREIVKSIIKMDFYEPEIIPGERKYFNEKHLKFKENHFYSWHIIPTEEVIAKLNEEHAKTIFVVRNIYDLVVSIYYHFYNNIDADIGRGNNKDKFLKQFSFEEGLSLIISGFDEDGLRWNGMQEVVINCNEILKASSQCESLLLTFEEMVTSKENAVRKMADFLSVTLSNSEIAHIAQISSFETMKNEAKSKSVGESHFREGSHKKNREKLSLFHQVQLRQIIKVHAPDLYENAAKLKMQNLLEV